MPGMAQLASTTLLDPPARFQPGTTRVLVVDAAGTYPGTYVRSWHRVRLDAPGPDGRRILDVSSAVIRDLDEPPVVA